MGIFGGKSFDEVARMYLDHHASYSRSRRTAASQVRVLSAHLSGVPWPSITRDTVRAFVAARREQGASGATINRNLAALSRMATLADLPNPVRGFQRFRETAGRTRYLSRDEAQRLINEASDHLRPLIYAALLTGGRLGELLALRWADVDLESGVLWFRSGTTKNRRERMLPVSPALVDVLRTVGPGEPLAAVFSFHGRPLRSIRTSFARARRRSGLGRDVTFHVLRHTYASWSMMNGLDPYRLQKYLGHSQMSLTARYAHLSPEYLKDGARFFGPPRDGQ